jgi:uncharacterized protein
MLIVDAGPLIAAADAVDRNHERCIDLLTHARPPLIVPVLVITEVSYFLADRLGAHVERAFAESLRSGELAIEPVEPADWDRIAELLDEYVELELGVVDASVVAACERLGQTELATLDRRHFSAVRPRHCAALKILPV